jgi:hypothetical protein
MKAILRKNFNNFSNLTIFKYSIQTRNFTDKFKDKETAEEKFYFDKEESKNLSKIRKISPSLIEKN